MIAVEIPAADRPQVVPVDPLLSPPGSPYLVDQRVALAWRETCVNRYCDGGIVRAGDTGRQVGYCTPCNATGERMVVGWTAEVDEVVNVRSHHPVSHLVTNYVLALPDGTAQAWIDGINVDLPAADWSPDRYALVLRDVQPWQRVLPMTGAIVNCRQVCRPFHGFAELSKVLAS